MPPILQVVHDAFAAVESDRIHTTRLLGNPKLTACLPRGLACCSLRVGFSRKDSRSWRTVSVAGDITTPRRDRAPADYRGSD